MIVPVSVLLGAVMVSAIAILGAELPGISITRKRLERKLGRELLSTVFGHVWEGLSWISTLSLLLVTPVVFIILTDWWRGEFQNSDLALSVVAASFIVAWMNANLIKFILRRAFPAPLKRYFRRERKRYRRLVAQYHRALTEERVKVQAASRGGSR